MKIFCQTDGIHFKDEFKDTLKPPCNFWGDIGMTNLPVKTKYIIWDWMFSLPADEIGLKFNVGISFSVKGIAIAEESRFENIVPDYKKLSEKEQKEFQRQYFKGKIDLSKLGVPEKHQKDKIVN